MSTSLEQKLLNWTARSSDTEQAKQDRSERMIREAVMQHPELHDCLLKVYAKGSYANNTNVRMDSDVDIAVQCSNVFYYAESEPGSKPGDRSPYTGRWTPSKLRSELVAALEAKFPGQVITSGSTAISIESSGARVDADVVPCFDYRYYYPSGNYREGARIFRVDGTHLNNYPNQQLENGRKKNVRTGQRYKKAVRIMKRLENAMVADGVHSETSSFFIECLVYNVPDQILVGASWVDTVKGILAHVYNGLEGSEPAREAERWLEVNECKFLFSGDQKWTRSDGRAFALAGWGYLELPS